MEYKFKPMHRLSGLTVDLTGSSAFQETGETQARDFVPGELVSFDMQMNDKPLMPGDLKDGGLMAVKLDFDKGIAEITPTTRRER